MNKKESNSASDLIAKRSNRRLFAGLTAIAVIALCAISCNPEAKWATKDVDIAMEVTTVSAGFVECSFSTNKEAYYYINVVPVEEGKDPMTQQKQFMTLALDSADMAYKQWRKGLLENGEFNIAPFKSHILQYGDVNHFFTGLLPDTDYWIYAFVVNPENMTPVGKLHLVSVHTKTESIVDVHFAYRIKGTWDYIYPLDSKGNIFPRFPYNALTKDSLSLVAEGIDDPVIYFVEWMIALFVFPEEADVLYGVKATNNDGWSSDLEFKKGHTYYTAISGYDGLYENTTIYKFTWTGENCELFFHDTDPANIVLSYGDDEKEQAL